MAGISSLSDLGTGSVEYAIGFGLGVALAEALKPIATKIQQEAYSTAPDLQLQPQDAARIVAQGLESLGWGEGEAQLTGVDPARFDLLEQSELIAPPVGQLLDLIRRGLPNDSQVTHALRKAQLEPEWDTMVQALSQTMLHPEAVATMIQRSILPNPDILPFTAKSEGSNVPPMPMVNLDPIAQVAAYGTSKEQLQALARIVGLPASPDLAARMFYRGIINEGAFNLAIAEGNTRNEWAPFLLRGFEQILTANEYAELQLRGYYDRATRLANTAKHGMSTADSDLLYDVLGRSIPVHQILTGTRRGGVFNGPTDSIPADYLGSLERGNIRPEYYNLAYANRESYPSYFVIKPLVQSGAITLKRAEELFMGMGWPEDVAKLAPAAFASTSTGTSTSHVSKAETQVWTALHKSYVNSLSTDSEAQTDLAAIGLTTDQIPAVLKLWGVERNIVRRSLSPVQLRKAVTDKMMTDADALARLEELGYSKDDAGILLSE